MTLRRLFITIFSVVSVSLYAQTGNFGVGYAVGWYYGGLKNVKASLVEFNTGKEYLTEKITASSINHGFTVTMKGNKLGMIFPVTWLKNQSEFTGVNPVSGSNEVYTISNIHVMWGAGWRIDKENKCFAFVLQQGFAGYRYKEVGTGSNATGWNGLPGTQGCAMFGASVFYEYFPTARIGFRLNYYWQFFAGKNWFSSTELRHNFSQLSAGLTFYIRKQYGR
ncbi:MAG: hypothetical protein L6Q81_02280 [Bacteroidia bacterium]|nr:hypothetical protein [Bacteroidia bacterium]